MSQSSGRGGGSVQPLKEIEAAVIGDFVPVESIEVSQPIICQPQLAYAS